MFGEKGAGKTAMRMQMAAQIEEFNRRHENTRSFVIEYDDFNPFLDRFAERLSARTRRKPTKVLDEWKLWDHMDAILSLGVTSVVDRLLGTSQPSGPAGNILPDDAVRRLDRFQRRDLLLLAACYDNSLTESFDARWFRLRRKLHYFPWQNWGIKLLGMLVTAGVVGTAFYQQHLDWFKTVWPWLIIAAGLGAVDGPVLAVVDAGVFRVPQFAVRESRYQPLAQGADAILPAATSTANRCPTNAGPTTATSCSISSRGC